MDFRTCPACKASILEDDVDDCPFCGTSLAGKSAKPAPAKPAAAKPGPTAAAKPATKPGATPTAKPAASRPAPAKRPETQEEDEDADPFEVDTSAVRDAHPVSAKRTKATPLAATCPMCETTGYISPKHAGKEVKCCNPECMVPVFKAPPMPKKEVPVEETPQGMPLANKITYGVLGLIVLVGAGIAYSIFTGDDGSDPNVTGPSNPIDSDPGDPVDPEEDGDPDPVDPTGPAHSLDYIVETSVSEMREEANRSNVDRGTAYLGHQMTAEANFILGDAEAGRSALDRLHRVVGRKRYYDVAPLAELAWHHFREGDVEAANAALDEAVTASADLPTVARQSLDDATLLGSALCRAGRWEEALALVDKLHTDDPRGRLSVLFRGALEFQTFDFSEEFDRPYLMDMPDSLAVAITRSLCARGAWDEAWEWTTHVEGVDVQNNCQAAWAGALTIQSHRTGDADLLSRLDAAVAEADPVGQARMWTAVADSHLLLDQKEEAEAALEDALALLSGIEIPEPVALPSMRSIHNSKGRPFAGLSDPAPHRSLALAWADVGHVQAGLGNDEAAWEAFSFGLDAMRGTTPSPSATQALVDACDNQSNDVKSRLAAAGVSDANFRGFYQYRGQCEELNNLAKARFQVQASLMTRAVDLGLVDQVWGHIKERGAASQAPDLLEPWYRSSVPGRILVVGGRAGNTSVLSDMGTTITPPPRASDLDDLHYRLVQMNANTPTREISGLITELYEKASFDDDLLDARFLDLVARIYHTRGLAEAFSLARTPWTEQASVVEDAFRLLGGLAVVSGDQDKMWDHFSATSGRLEVTENVAAYRGMIDGALALQSKASAREPVEEADNE